MTCYECNQEINSEEQCDCTRREEGLAFASFLMRELWSDLRKHRSDYPDGILREVLTEAAEIVADEK
jgi:hypothetical protein